MTGTLDLGGGLFLAMLFCGGVWVLDDVLRQMAEGARLRVFAAANRGVFIMALFIDVANAFTCEIVDGELGAWRDVGC